MTCHQIWRYYKPVDPARMEMVSEIDRCCYNCAERGHLGDDCNKPRPFHVQGGRIGTVISAFGEGNVPEWAKVSKSALPPRKAERTKSSVKSGKRRGNNMDQDDWFANNSRNTQRDSPPKPVRKIGGIKMKPITSATSTASRQSNGLGSSQVRSPSPVRQKPPPSSKFYHSRPPQSREDREWESEIENWRMERDKDRMQKRADRR